MIKQKNLRLIYRKCAYILICSLAAIPAPALAQARPALAPNGDASFLAQATPDGTLPTTVEQLREIMRINGGEREGDNLFHSFEEFSIPEGMEAIFENATDIKNIFTRVTGDEISNIDGILTTQGDANFFLINPNGIIFGENAQLDVGGSFLATTAESVEFEDGAEFSASNPDESILTVSFPVGLDLGSNSGAITVNGNGHQIASNSENSPIDLGNTDSDLSVTSGKTLALIGGEIRFTGGIVTAEGGKIEISSLNSGSVRLQEINDGFNFNYDDAVTYQDITLADQALVDTSGTGKGRISLTGNNVSLFDGSLVLNQNQGNVNSESININALGSVKLSGTSPNTEVPSAIRSQSLNTGQGGKIVIETKQLFVLDEARINASVFSQAAGNEVNINVTDSVKVVDGGIISSTTVGAGNAGNLNIKTKSIEVARGSDNNRSNISATSFNTGNAGNLNIDTEQLQVLNGASVSSTTASAGNAGNLNIKTKSIEVAGGSDNSRSNISATSFNTGNAGNLNIDTEQLQVLNGASVSSSAFTEGDAGNIVVNASKSVEVDGFNQNFNGTNPESTIRSAVIVTTSARQQALGFLAIPTRNAGNVTINTPSLTVSQKGSINVENQGTGNAGTLAIDAEDIDLDDTGSITATAASGEGGNIVINTRSLTAKKNSNVTTNAGGEGNGGNIQIDAEVLTGLENSDITANAIAGNGGNIEITSDYIFGFNSTTELTLFSDITASSELGIDGTVTIFSPESNIGEEVIIVGRDERVFKDRDLVNDKCSSINEQRVRVQDLGVPIAPSPFDFNYDEDLPDVNGKRSPIANSSPAPNEEEIIQANTVKVLPDGRTFLVAETKSNHPVSEPQLCTR